MSPFVLPASIPSPDISYLELGPFRIHFYALFILVGIVFAVLVADRRLRAAGQPRGVALDLAIWAVPFGIVGARVWHVLTHPEDYFFPGADLLRALYLWEGGLAIFGAVVFGLLGIAIGAGRARIPALVFLDAIAPGMLIAQATGRLGNYFNQELFGAPTTLPWGLQVDPGNPAIPPGLPPDTLFHPLFLYEILWNLLGLVVILMIERIARRRGRVLTGSGTALGLYLLWYGAGRAWLESIRLDPSELLIGGVKVNILAALLAAAVGVAIVVRASRRPGGRADDEAVSADADRAGTR
ncbi:MAG: prolipoprotein diacylglyceryl transferase [Leifsonia sp.]|jgi:prolipoprotein diacylglyceryl transferase|nr:prolipoprotein diacylglyceryl transferase [Leifsonia sp.]